MIADWGIPRRSYQQIRCDAHTEYSCSCLAAKNVKLLCVLASREGLQHVQAEFPDLEVMLFIVARGIVVLTWRDKIWVAAVDETLTAEGIISPGLGDTVCAGCPLIASDS